MTRCLVEKPFWSLIFSIGILNDFKVDSFTDLSEGVAKYQRAREINKPFDAVVIGLLDHLQDQDLLEIDAQELIFIKPAGIRVFSSELEKRIKDLESGGMISLDYPFMSDEFVEALNQVLARSGD